MRHSVPETIKHVPNYKIQPHTYYRNARARFFGHQRQHKNDGWTLMDEHDSTDTLIGCKAVMREENKVCANDLFA